MSDLVGAGALFALVAGGIGVSSCAARGDPLPTWPPALVVDIDGQRLTIRSTHPLGATIAWSDLSRRISQQADGYDLAIWTPDDELGDKVTCTMPTIIGGVPATLTATLDAPGVDLSLYEQMMEERGWECTLEDDTPGQAGR